MTDVRKDMRKKERTVNLIMASVLSAVMGVLATFLVRGGMSQEALAATPGAGMYAANIVESVIVGVIVVLVIPFGRWGRALAARTGATPPGLKYTLLNCLPVSVGSAVIVSTVVSFVNIFQAHGKIPPQVAPPLLAMWLPTWCKLLPISIVVSYVLAVLLSPFVVRAVGLGGPPKQG